jgi:hypothetical protein
LKENLNDADEIMSGLVTDLVMGKEPNIASMMDHLNLATNMAVHLATGEDPEKVFEHSPREEQELVETLLVQHALYLTECFGTFSIKTRKSDEETAAYGFKPDPALEHDDENVIQDRIDRGLQPKPDWWDTRYDYFMRVPSSYIGVLTPEEKLAKEKKEQTRRRRTYNPRTNQLEDFLSRDPNAHVGVQTAQAQGLLDSTFQYIVAAPDAVLRAIETLLVRTGPVGRGLVTIGRFLGVLLAMLKTTQFALSFTSGDYDFLQQFEKKFESFTQEMVDMQTTALETERVFVLQQRALAELNALTHDTSANATMLSVFPTMAYMSQYTATAPKDVCLIAQHPSYVLFEKGLNDAIAIVRYRLQQEALDPVSTEEQVRDLKRTYEILTAADTSPWLQSKRFYQWASYTVSSLRAVDISKPVRLVEGSFEFAERLIRWVGDQRAVIEQGLRLVAKARRAGEMFLGQVRGFTGQLQDYATKYVANTNIFQRIMHGRTDLEWWHVAVLSSLSGLLTTVSTLMSGLKVDPRAAAAFLASKKELITLMDVWENDPGVAARFGAVLTSNPYLFFYIVQVIGSIENRGHGWMQPKLDAYEKILKEGRTFGPGDKQYFARFFARPLLSLLSSTRHVVTFGALSGVIVLYVQTMFRSGHWFPSIFRGSAEDAGSGTGQVVAYFANAGIMHKLLGAAQMGKTGLMGFLNGYLAYSAISQLWTPQINLIGVDGAVRVLTEEELEAEKIPKSKKEELKRSTAIEKHATKSKQIAGYAAGLQLVVLMMAFLMVFGNKFVFGFLKGFLPGGNLIGNKPHWTTYKTRQDRRRK